MVKGQRIHQLLQKVILQTFTEGRKRNEIIALTVSYQCLSKIERKYFISPSLIDDELPTFIEGRKKITITNFH